MIDRLRIDERKIEQDEFLPLLPVLSNREDPEERPRLDESLDIYDSKKLETTLGGQQHKKDTASLTLSVASSADSTFPQISGFSNPLIFGTRNATERLAKFLLHLPGIRENLDRILRLSMSDVCGYETLRQLLQDFAFGLGKECKTKEQRHMTRFLR
ncbi:uncharacterized protein RCO7_14197 [Rhynchosporium graminicola]|uniref:Uncharacterized protein n=1 Tax=Rhynchosporium graminicola TaxID=2792576 RepID=A0A1E1JYR2_9HELO|nr:uncharacterized protein RCO7_14197 [Rhynchosporium commune]